MHLTPEQIERQPFRMQKRGYDLVDVRDFLREIAVEFRAREAAEGSMSATGATYVDGSTPSGEAADVLADAARIRSAAESDAASTHQDAREQAELVLAEAEAARYEIIAEAREEAEAEAKERSMLVLAASQARLDQLLEQERYLREQVSALEAPAPTANEVGDKVVIDLRETDTSLADFVKTRVREEML